MASGSKSSTQTQSSQQTSVKNVNLQDTGGITVADNAGNTKLSYVSVSNTSDYGAIGAATQLAGDATSGALHAATTLGQTAIDAGSSVANHGLDNAAAAYQSGLTFGTDALNTVANLLQDSALRESNLTNNALAGYQSIASQNSASSATQIQHVAIYLIVAAVAIVVLPKVFES